MVFQNFIFYLQATKSLSRGHTRSVTLRWSAWNPFLQPTNPHVTIGLIGGPTPSPDAEFVYKVPNTTMQDEISSKTAGGLMAFQWGFGFKVNCRTFSHMHKQFDAFTADKF